MVAQIQASRAASSLYSKTSTFLTTEPTSTDGPNNKVIPTLTGTPTESLALGGVNLDKEPSYTDDYIIRLFNAASTGNQELVERLLTDPIVSELQAESGIYGLILDAAVTGFHTATVASLVAGSGKVDSQVIERAVESAAFAGQHDIVDILLNSVVGLDSECRGRILEKASQKSLKNLVKTILRSPSNLDKGGLESAFQVAVNLGNTYIVELFISSDTIIELESFCQALMISDFGGHKSTLNLLLTKGPTIYSNFLPRALELSVSKARKDLVKRLIDQGAVFDRDCAAKPGLLGAAAFIGNRRLVEDLLNKGADVKSRDTLWGTALQASAYSGSKDIVELLLAKGCQVDARGGIYGTALEAAAYAGHAEIIELLLARGQRFNGCNAHYRNIIFTNTYNRRDRIIELISSAVDTNPQGPKSAFETFLEQPTTNLDDPLSLATIDEENDNNRVSEFHDTYQRYTPSVITEFSLDTRDRGLDATPRPNRRKSPHQESIGVTRFTGGDRILANKRQRLAPHTREDSPNGVDNDESSIRPDLTDSTPLTSSSASRRTLACHFYKKDPHRWEKCGKFGFPSIAKLKEHLKAQHRVVYCTCCRQTFSLKANENSFDCVELIKHSKATACSPNSDPPARNGIHMEAWDIFSKRHKGRPDLIWRQIWERIFGDETLKTSPFYEQVDHTTAIHSYHRYILDRIPKLGSSLELVDQSPTTCALIQKVLSKFLTKQHESYLHQSMDCSTRSAKNLPISFQKKEARVTAPTREETSQCIQNIPEVPKISQEAAPTTRSLVTDGFFADEQFMTTPSSAVANAPHTTTSPLGLSSSQVQPCGSTLGILDDVSLLGCWQQFAWD